MNSQMSELSEKERLVRRSIKRIIYQAILAERNRKDNTKVKGYIG